MTDAKPEQEKVRRSPSEMRAERNQHRDAIMDSELITSGNQFNSLDAAELIGRDRCAAANLLRQMERDGLITVVMVSGKNLYSAKKPPLYPKSWRTCSNAFLRRRRYSRIGGVI